MERRKEDLGEVFQEIKDIKRNFNEAVNQIIKSEDPFVIEKLISSSQIINTYIRFIKEIRTKRLVKSERSYQLVRGMLINVCKITDNLSPKKK